MKTTRRLARFVIAGLIVSACSSSATDPTPADAETVDAAASTSQETTTQGAIENDDPGGSDTAARGSLAPIVAEATVDWPTDWSKAIIDLSELLLGIQVRDPRDVIQPIDNPHTLSIAAISDWLDPEEPGVLVQVNGQARFYPLSILHRHEVVNDEIAGIPVAVTYCPLCNTAMAFDRRLDDTVLRFGVSGLLRNSDLVMWDDQTVSLWQQVTGEAIVGELTGHTLTPISTAIVSFADFAESFPEGLSLSYNTGSGIPYGANPYGGYSSRSAPYGFYTGAIDPRYAALDRVVGVNVGNGAKAYPFAEIAPIGVVNDSVGGIPIVVFWGGETRDALDTDLVATGRAIGTGIAYLSTVDGQILTFAKADSETGQDPVWVDDQTESTWSLLGEATSGPLAGTRLEIATHRNEFWFVWGAFFPNGDVFEG